MSPLPSVVRYALFEVAVFVVLAALLRVSPYSGGFPLRDPLVHAAYQTFFFLTPLAAAFFFARCWRSRDLRLPGFTLRVVGVGAVTSVAIFGGFLGHLALTCNGEDCIGLFTVPIVGTIGLMATIALSVPVALVVRAAEAASRRPPVVLAIPLGIVAVAFVLWLARGLSG